MNVQEKTAVAAVDATRLSPFVALKHRDFVLLLGGRWISTVGSQMMTVGVAYHVYHLNESTWELGLLGLFRLVPVLALSLVGGGLADSVDRRRVMLAAQPVLLLCSVALAFSTLAGFASLPVIYTAVAVAAAAGAIYGPAQQAIVPALVPREHLPNALSWSITTMEVATIVGPALGGIAIAVIGLAGVYAVDAVSFLAVIVALLLMRVRLGAATVGSGRGWRAATEGLRFIRGNRIVFAVMSLDFLAMFWGSATVLLPALADKVLHVGTTELGFLFAAPAAGAVVGAVAMTAFGNRIRKPGWPLLLSVAAYGATTVGVGLSTAVPLALLFLAGTGAADTVSMTLRHQILQLLTPNEVRGRVTAANQVFVQGGPQLGSLEAGAVAAVFGVAFSIASGGGACVVGVLLVALLVPSIRRYRNAV